MLGFIGMWAAQTCQEAISWLSPASNERRQGTAPLGWDNLCPDVTSEIRKHLSLADHLRVGHLSHDFHTASRAREHAAQQRLLSIARDACSDSFLTEVGQAIQSHETRRVTFPVDRGEDENLAGATQVLRESVNPGHPNPVLNPPRKVGAPQGLYLEVATQGCWVFAGARWVTFRVAVKGAVTGTCIWGYLSMFRRSPDATPTVCLWIDPRHALPTLSLLCCACIDGLPTQDGGVLAPAQSFRKPRTLARDVRRLLRTVPARSVCSTERVRELEDEVFAAAALLNRYLGSLHITINPSPGLVECVSGISILLAMNTWDFYLLLSHRPVLLLGVVLCLPALLALACALLACVLGMATVAMAYVVFLLLSRVVM